MVGEVWPTGKNRWWWKLEKELEGGFTAIAKGGPYETKREAELNLGWKRNEWETYED